MIAAGLLIAGNIGKTPNAGDLYTGSGVLGLWMTMRIEWRKNRREQQRRDDSDGDDS